MMVGGIFRIQIKVDKRVKVDKGVKGLSGFKRVKVGRVITLPTLTL